MKIKVDRSPFFQIISHVQSVVETKSSLPALSCLLLDANEEALAVTGTDLQARIEERGQANVETPGRVLVNAHLLQDIVRRLPDGSEVSLALDEEKNIVLITAGRSNFRLPVVDAATFPDAAPPSNERGTFSLQANILRQILDRTKAAMSTEETRYYLNGVYFHHHTELDQFCAVATDGHRLARILLSLADSQQDYRTALGAEGIIIPRKSVLEVRRLVENAEGDINLTVSANHVSFQIGSITFNTQLVDGTFPNYQRVIPENHPVSVEVNTRDLSVAVDRVSVVCDDTRFVKLDIEESQVRIEAKSPMGASADDVLEAELKSGSPVSISFNARFLLDVLQQCGGDVVRLCLGDSGAPACLENPSDKSTFYVLMPVRY